MDRTLPKLLRRIANEYPEVPGQYYKAKSGEFIPISFAEEYSLVLDYAAGLLSLGQVRGDRVGLIGDNRPDWLHLSMAIMAIGCSDVPRGCDANAREITYILSFAECRVAVLENDAQLAKVLDNKNALPLLAAVVLFDAPSTERAAAAASAGLDIISLEALRLRGRGYRAENPERVEAELETGAWDDIATVIFTSGTTGEPKGVMLSHGNFLCQLEELPSRIVLYPGDRALCVLPVWHAFERLCEYVILIGASAIIYSKPIGSVLLGDFAKMNPQIMPSVPRIWESVYDGIYRLMRKTGGATWIIFNFFVEAAILQSRFQRKVFGRSPVFSRGQRVFEAIACFLPFVLLWPVKALGGLLVFRKIRLKLGNSFRGGVSGGGALPPNIDEFFWAVGVNVVEGYGLTETAPVTAVRPFGRPVFGTIGTPISCCEMKIVDESGRELPPGVKGLVLVRGGNVMKGYYRKPELTARVISPEGWLDTGDLGFKTHTGEVILRGRKKDTIVLRGGENIEPLPVELKLNESRYVAQSVVVGQDQRYLGALIIVNKDELSSWAVDNSIEFASFADIFAHEQTRKLYESEIAALISAKNGFKAFERINRFVLLEKPFELGVELSAKQEIMRYRLDDLYRAEMKILFG